MPYGVQEADWWKAGNEKVKQFPMTISLTDAPISVKSSNAQDAPAPPITTPSYPNQQSDSSDDFEEEFMGLRKWPFLTPGFRCEFKSITVVEDERDLSA